MPDFLFDGPNKLVIEPAGVGNTVFSVTRDIYSAWKRWVVSGAGAQWQPAFIAEGGTPIGATGFFTGGTIILVNGWKIRGADHNHQLFLTGNIFSGDGVVTSPNPSYSVEVFINSSVSAQGISTGGGTGSFTSQDRLDLLQTRDHARAANSQTKGNT